uniref:Mitochondrial escape protein 2 n=1 Tax=Psilocybe cubensis TaxID=181762 RepID=A0A8H7Y4C2_PSICU
MLRLLPLGRSYTTAAAAVAPKKEAWLYLDSVFPVQLALWDFRHYIGILREDNLLSTLESRLEGLSSVHGFKPLEIQPHRKDGGVFVRFSYSPSNLEEGKEWSALQAALSKEVEKQGGLPSWSGVRSGTLWVVRGSPWKEDMNRFASPLLRVAFDGPDIQEQSLYELCRPFGRIRDLAPPTPVPAGTLRSSLISFQHVHSATIARNVLHGLEVPSTSGSAPSKTRIRAQYDTPVKAHDIRNWMSSHPKIMLPIIIFLLGTLTYTIFDPIRSVMVKAKMLNWFDYRKFRLYEWLRVNTVDRLSTRNETVTKLEEEVWKERKEAESALKGYLSDMPTTIAFVHGPAGSGKITMLNSVLKQSRRTALIIDCRELNNSPSDSSLVDDLAKQTGYWPVFNFVNSMGNLIDLASVGLMGQKAGISSSLPEQLKQILGVVTVALRSVSSVHRASIQRQIQDREAEEARRIQDARKRHAIMSGTWHDGRLDCIAGNGVMSELGIGDELFSEDMEITLSSDEFKNISEEQDNTQRKKKALEDVEAIKALPIVVIRNFAASSSSKEEVLDVLSQWGASLTENHIAHVVVLSDNRENSKRLAKALPTKPLSSIALSDADPKSSLSFVKQKLSDAGVDIGISTQETHLVERLGGRASDLESLIHKVRSGMTVEEAIDDIISRGVAETRKNAFGEDAEDAKNLPWTRYQAWKVLKTLSTKPETGYYDILVDFPFKGDENALRSMEHAELISISTKDGRPSTIRPGKPVFRYVFERVVNDKVFRATQELAYNEKQILDTEAKIQGYEQELSLLIDTMEKENRLEWFMRPSRCRERTRVVGQKLYSATRKVEELEHKNVELKKILSQVI